MDDSEVMKRLDIIETNQLEKLFEGKAKEFIMKIANMDAPQRKKELITLHDGDSDKEYITNVINFFYEILREHLALKNEELLAADNSRILMENRFYENTTLSN